MNEEKKVRLVALNNIWPVYIIEHVARLPCRVVEGVVLVAAISSKVQQIETQIKCGRAQLFMIVLQCPGCPWLTSEGEYTSAAKA